MDERHSVTEGRQAFTRDGQRGAVAVESDEMQTGQLGEEAFRVAPRTEGGVDEDGTGAIGAATGEGGLQQFDASVQEDRVVRVIVRHRSTLAKRVCPCIEVPVRGCGPGVGEVRQGRFGQRPQCRDWAGLNGRVR